MSEYLTVEEFLDGIEKARNPQPVKLDRRAVGDKLKQAASQLQPEQKVRNG
jgi:hypothetical protein